MENKIISGLWSGPALTNIECLCIRSFQDMGHEFHLYTTEPCARVPEGTVVHSAYEIVPEGSRNWFSGPNHFSDWFRVNLIYQTGGFYVDVDTVALRPFDFPEPYVFISEYVHGGPSLVIDNNYLSGCVFKAPAGAPILKHIIDIIESRDPRQGCHLPVHLRDMNDGIGPPMFRRAVPHFGLECYIKPPVVFDAVDWHRYGQFVDSGYQWEFSDMTYAIHLRSSFWRGNSTLLPNQKYPEDSLFEQLKKKHGVE